jgi:small-conductance mechanosensitive channel
MTATRAPMCHLTAFGDSSVDFELRFWMNDPQNGISNIVDDVLRRVWHKFHEHGVSIPFPQRDLHLKTLLGTSKKLAAPGLGVYRRPV